MITKKMKEERKNKKLERKSFILYPQDRFKVIWDVFMTVLIIFASVITPLKIAFEVEPSRLSKSTENCVDILFLIDIIIILNSAFYDERDFKLIQERDEIARQYGM